MYASVLKKLNILPNTVNHFSDEQITDFANNVATELKVVIHPDRNEGREAVIGLTSNLDENLDTINPSLERETISKRFRFWTERDLHFQSIRPILERLASHQNLVTQTFISALSAKSSLYGRSFIAQVTDLGVYPIAEIDPHARALQDRRDDQMQESALEKLIPSKALREARKKVYSNVLYRLSRLVEEGALDMSTAKNIRNQILDNNLQSLETKIRRRIFGGFSVAKAEEEVRQLAEYLVSRNPKYAELISNENIRKQEDQLGEEIYDHRMSRHFALERSYNATLETLGVDSDGRVIGANDKDFGKLVGVLDHWRVLNLIDFERKRLGVSCRYTQLQDQEFVRLDEVIMSNAPANFVLQEVSMDCEIPTPGQAPESLPVLVIKKMGKAGPELRLLGRISNIQFCE